MSQWLTSEVLTGVLIQTASGESIERGRQDAHAERLAVTVGASVAAAAAPFLREALQDSASTDGAAAEPTTARARQQPHPRMAIHVSSNAAAPDWPKQRLGPVNWSVRRGSGGRRHGRLDLSVNISLVFTIVT